MNEEYGLQFIVRGSPWLERYKHFVIDGLDAFELNHERQTSPYLEVPELRTSCVERTPRD